MIQIKIITKLKAKTINVISTVKSIMRKYRLTNRTTSMKRQNIVRL